MKGPFWLLLRNVTIRKLPVFRVAYVRAFQGFIFFLSSEGGNEASLKCLQT